MTFFRIGVNRESGAVTIWMEAPCGMKPIIVCADLEGVKEFAEMLLDFYKTGKEEKRKIEKVSDILLRQALGDDECFYKEVE
ncbi:MAG: hypothetical protein H8E40_13795 [Chloroflexi bacterium]|nr:hypothetical protein [Chloroflexota bacterium]